MNKRDRQALYDKTNGRCGYCGCKLQKGWHADHKEPVIRKLEWKDSKLVSGKEMRCPENDTIENQMASCPPCNINKHSMTLEGFRMTIKQYVESLSLRSTQYKMAKKFGLIQETGKPVKFYFEVIKEME